VEHVRAVNISLFDAAVIGWIVVALVAMLVLERYTR
jgi:hypothetical protein